MSKMMQGMARGFGDYFTGFDERAGETRSHGETEQGRGGDAACGFCLAAIVGALGFAISASAAAPF